MVVLFRLAMVKGCFMLALSFKSSFLSLFPFVFFLLSFLFYFCLFFFCFVFNGTNNGDSFSLSISTRNFKITCLF